MGPVSRGSVSLLFALIKGEPIEWRARRRRRGFEGWGRHLRGGPATAAKATCALTHPSNLRETGAHIIRTSATRSHSHGGCRRKTRMPNALGLEHAAIPQQRIEDPGKAAGEGDDGHLFPAARGDEGGGGDGSHAGDGAQARHARILDGEVLDPLVGVRELPIEGAHEGKQRRDHREQAAWQGQALDAMDKALRTAGRDTVAVLAEQGPDERDIARARPDNGVPDQQAAPHVALGVGEAMGGAVRAEQARLREGPGITPVGLHLTGARRIHGREVRVRDDDLVAKRLETPRHPFAVGRGFDQDPGARPGPEHGREALGLGADAPLDDLTPLGEDVDLTFPLVHIDANMVHGWPLLSAALTAVCSCGAAYATTSSERPAASSHLSSQILWHHRERCRAPSRMEPLPPERRRQSLAPFWTGSRRERSGLLRLQNGRYFAAQN